MRCCVRAMPKPQPDQSLEETRPLVGPHGVSKFHILSGRHLADLQSSVHHVFWQLYHLSPPKKTDQTHNISQSFSTSIPKPIPFRNDLVFICNTCSKSFGTSLPKPLALYFNNWGSAHSLPRIPKLHANGRSTSSRSNSNRPRAREGTADAPQSPGEVALYRPS